jgi:hypothetical protein
MNTGKEKEVSSMKAYITADEFSTGITLVIMQQTSKRNW